MQVARAIALEATLSFLGLGVPITEPSLGLLIANGYQYMLSGKYWISFYPGHRAAGHDRRHQPGRRPVARRAEPAAASDDAPRPLEVRNLRTHFFTRAGVVKAVDDVSFSVARGEVLGLVGESGSGKIGDRLLDHRPGRSAGTHRRRRDPASRARTSRSCPRREMRALRGNRIAMIFQDPMMTLNPVLRIDTQMIEAVQAHDEGLARRGARAARATRSAWSASRRPTSGCAPIRTSSPAACASAWRSPSRCCTSPT